jgi:cysteine synthase A
LLGFVLGFSFSWSYTALRTLFQQRKKEHLQHFTPKPIELRSDDVVHGVTGLIGNTPLVRINSLSDALGVEILGKAEFLNPGGSAKDRVALQMIEDAERLGYLHPHTGSRIFEGTVGSTGISLALIARARGYDATIIMPDDVAEEKVKALMALGADVERVRPAGIVDKNQYVQNLAKRRAQEFGQKQASDSPSEPHIYILQSPSESLLVSATSQHIEFTDDGPDMASGEIPSTTQRGYFTDQFENQSNFDSHYKGTGPEIWSQTGGRIDAFVAGAGTGGTVAGVGRYLKSMNEDVYVAIADPEGSGLFNKVKHGVMYDRNKAKAPNVDTRWIPLLRA